PTRAGRAPRAATRARARRTHQGSARGAPVRWRRYARAACGPRAARAARMSRPGASRMGSLALAASLLFVAPVIRAAPVSGAPGAAVAPAAAARGALIARPDSLQRLTERPGLVHPVPDYGLLGTASPAPKVAYGSFAAARESLVALTRRALGGCADSARWRRGPTPFLYRDRRVLE